MELRYGLEWMPRGRNHARLVREYKAFITKDLRLRIVPFDHAAAEQAATLMAARRRFGRPRELRDTMIAGIAVSRRATLATRNLRHFDDLPTPVVDPWAAP
jgi:predicted nucleic acid-binding protein